METFAKGKETFEQTMQQWINSEGDLDDFIFYFEEKNHIEEI